MPVIAISTFSIVARDPGSGDLGVATASKFLAVGAVVPYAVAEVGAVATQSYANVSYGPRAVNALKNGIPLEQIHAAFKATDEHHAQRQYGMVDASGNSLTFTGDGCHEWAGGISKDNVTAQGNLLAGPEVIDALINTYETTQGPLAERLLSALQAADAAGGDKRGRQSATLLVVRQHGGYGGQNDRYIDLRVDDHTAPIPELKRLLHLQRLYFEKPAQEDILTITPERADILTRILVKTGHLPSTQAWTQHSETALRNLAGAENLEERMVTEGHIDKTVLEFLSEKYA